MKYLSAAFAAVVAGAACAAPPVTKPESAPLRVTLRQYHPGAAQAPRRLNAGERAELRRQIAETAKPPKAAKRR
jgi:hypothetical protein